MSKTIINNNAPKQLLPLAQKWADEGRSFYLGPDNIFKYNNLPFNYHGTDNISKEHGSWFICTEDHRAPKKLLTKNDIEEIQNAFIAGYKPENAYLILTNKCNLKCIMCHFHGEDEHLYKTKSKTQQMSAPIEQIKSNLDKLHKIGVKTVGYSSDGEPFLYEHWQEAFKHAASLGLSQGTITNGTLITEDLVKSLKSIDKNFKITISLHATSFEAWSKLTRIKNREMYERAKNAPLLFKKHGFYTAVTLVKTRENIHDVKDFLDEWVDKVDNVCINDELDATEKYDTAPRQFIGEPVGTCARSHGHIYVSTDGRVMPCCELLKCLTDDNEFNIPFWNINDDPKTLIPQMQESWITHKKAFQSVCSRCSMNYRYNASIDVNICGYKGTNFGIVTTVTKGNQIPKKFKLKKQKSESRKIILKRLLNKAKRLFS